MPCADILLVIPNTVLHTSATCPPFTEFTHEAELRNGRRILEYSREDALELTETDLEHAALCTDAQ